MVLTISTNGAGRQHHMCGVFILYVISYNLLVGNGKSELLLSLL